MQRRLGQVRLFRGGRAALRPEPGHLAAHLLGNTGGANNGKVICNYGFQNLSDKKLKHNVEPAGLEKLQQLFDSVAPKWYRRTVGNQKRTLGALLQMKFENGAQLEVIPFGDALVRRASALQRAQQQALEVPVRVRSRVVHVVLRGLVERHCGS